MTATKTIEPTTANYKKHHIEVGISTTNPDSKEPWIVIVTDPKGTDVDHPYSYESPSTAIRMAKTYIDFQLAEQSIAPRFLAFLQEAMTEGFNEEAVMRALVEGSNRYSEKGFFEDSQISGTGLF